MASAVVLSAPYVRGAHFLLGQFWHRESSPMPQKLQLTKLEAKTKPAIFSFFAGVGFLDLGFEKNGFDVVFVNEIYKPFLTGYQTARLGLKMKEPIFGYYDGDIKKLLDDNEGRDLQKKVNAAKRTHRLVGFIGGPPCPDFSVGGKNRGREGKNGVLSKVYTELIAKQQPDFFLFENVKGLWKTKVHRAFYEELKAKLKKAGYIMTERLINAVEYGAPQDRDRIILLGFRKKSFPMIGKEIGTDFPWEKFLKYRSEYVFGKGWPETDKFGENAMRKKPLQIIEELTVEYWFKKNNVEKHPNALDAFTPRQALPRFKVIPEGDVSRKSFKRIHRWRYSPTAAYGNNEVHLHPYKVRRLAISEVLAIQSLPKEFVLPSEMTLSDKFKSVGNGVPYEAASGVAKTIISFIKKNI